MSELIQESKYITVDEFMPKWTDVVESGKQIPNEGFSMGEVDTNEISLTKTHSCLVGEAHGLEPWKNNYTDSRGNGFCRYCKEVALGEREINGIKFTDAVNGLKELYTFKQGLYDHFMISHSEKLLRSGI